MAKATVENSSGSSNKNTVGSKSGSGCRKRSFLIQDLLEIGASTSHSNGPGDDYDETEATTITITSMTMPSLSGSRSRSPSQCSSASDTSSCSNVKKSRKSRTAFSDYQLNSLERSFEKHKYLSVQDRIELAARLNLTDTQVY